LWTGNLTAAESYVSTLLDHSTRHPLARWRAFGRGYEGVLAIKRGHVASGLRLLRAGFDELGEANTVFRFSLFLSEMAGRVGPCRADRGRARHDRGGDRAIRAHRRTLGNVRVPARQGRAASAANAPGAAAAAEDHFCQALDWARRQGALSWELRAVTNLARLLRDQSRAADAMALLQPVYDRFTEGVRDG
jgi:hypothetical protein